MLTKATQHLRSLIFFYEKFYVKVLFFSSPWLDDSPQYFLPEFGSASSDQRSDSLEKFYDSDLKYANGYYSYAKTTSKDTTIHLEKEVTNAYYPWKVNLNKQMVDSFLVDLQKNLKADSVYKSAFG